MKDSFGVALRSFANSIDLLREEEFRDVLGSVEKYLASNFNITKVERLAEVVKGGVPHLAPTLSDEPQYALFPVRVGENPNGLVASSFVTKRRMWVTPVDDEDGTNLLNAESKVDLWDFSSEGEELPDYLPLEEDDEGTPRHTPRTLIAVPISRRGSLTSLVYFESPDWVQPSERAQDELDAIARSVARLYDLQFNLKETLLATQRELEELEEACRVVSDWGAALSLFWAYPDRGDGEVLAALETALREWSSDGSVLLDDWQKNYSGGRIPEQIEEKIRTATYFVAYLSEDTHQAAEGTPRAASDGPPEGEPPRYVDNANVLYEAGVFQGLAEDRTTRSKNWLLVRERDSVEAPFDISTFNTLVVDRDAQGNLLERQFNQRLTERLQELFKND